MSSSKKNRDHRKVMLKRRAKLISAKAEARRRMWEKWSKAYAGKSKVMPMPTIADALSTRSNKENEAIKSGIESVTKYFNQNVESNAKEHNLKIGLPKNVVSFILPLDFYIPLPEPYNAASLNVASGSDVIDAGDCVTIVSDVAKVDDSAMKISCVILSICDSRFGKIEKVNNDKLNDIFKTAIDRCNAVIAAFQAIPTRHNHYMHRITAQSCSEYIDAFIFDRSTGKTTSEEQININGNVRSEVFQARALDKNELSQFQAAHVNQVFTMDKIFDLVSKFNDAINSRCFGNNEEAILLSDSYAELAIGYLYCESQKALGRNFDEVIQEYANFNSIGEIITKLSATVGLSNSQLRTRIGFDDWYKHCRSVRNDLTHRWMTGGSSNDDSLNALHFSGLLISKLCELMQAKFPRADFFEFYEKMELLSSASYFVSVLHKDIE